MKSVSDPLMRQTRRLVAGARARLIWETYAPTLAPAMLAIALFVLGAWFAVWEWLGDPWRMIALLAMLGVVAKSIVKALRLRWPNQSDARRRVEQDSGQAHRPLDVLDDRPAVSDDAWPAHLSQARTQAQQLSHAKPRPVLSPVDPYYLRFILPIIMFAAALSLAGFSFERLRYAVAPQWQAGVRASDATFEAWIDPPAHTGRPPVYFRDNVDVAVPEGSEFVARISGVPTAPRPRLKTGGRTEFLTLNRLGAKSYEVRKTVTKDAVVEWRIGRHREIWTLNVSPDLPPDVEWLDDPVADKRDRLVVKYKTEDDYALVGLQIQMALLDDDTTAETAFDAVTTFADITLPGTNPAKVESGETALDLTKHIWAGRKVIGRLVATDGAGQSSYSDPAWFTVPDKIFVEPLAKAVVEHRQLVMSGLSEDYTTAQPRNEADGIYNLYQPRQRMDRAPADIQRAAVLIEAVTDQPAQIFSDPAVYLGLRNAQSNIRYARQIDELRGLPADLWKIALRAEFGVLGTALEEMREAEEALREGMARRASQREMDTLFERYNLAVEAYTEELRRKAMEEGDFAEGGEGGGAGGMQSTDEIKELLKAIEDANKAGDTEGARIALARLAEVLENMKIQLAQGGGGEGGGEAMGGDMSEEMKEKLEELADLTGEQRKLQDETKQAEREQRESQGEGTQPGQGEMSPGELAERQTELQALLDALEQGIPAQGEGGSAAGEMGEEAGSQPRSGEPSGESGESGDPATSGSGEQGNGAESGTSPGGSTPNGEPSGGGDGQDPSGQAGSGGSTSDKLSAARRAMEDSQAALQAGRLGEGADAQAEALRALREVGEALVAQAQGEGRNGEQGQSENGDPLGRSDDGFNDGNAESDIEMRDNATRSRELLDELRRRAAEQERQQQERDYLERLLKRF